MKYDQKVYDFLMSMTLNRKKVLSMPLQNWPNIDDITHLKAIRCLLYNTSRIKMTKRKVEKKESKLHVNMYMIKRFISFGYLIKACCSFCLSSEY